MSYLLLHQTNRVAKKKHRCIWCGQMIPPGEKYISESSIYCREFQYHKWHEECYEGAKLESSDDYWEYEFEPYQNSRPEKEKVINESQKTPLEIL